MTHIQVSARPQSAGWACHVRVVDDDGSTSEHDVAVTRADLERFDPGATDPVDLVRRSFVFLLTREPKESILRSFDLPVIGRYFPDYELEIGYDGTSAQHEVG
jgi:hypothetical protein